MCRKGNLQYVSTKIVQREESVHTDEIEFKMPEINAVEIKELPRKIQSKLHPKKKKLLTSREVRTANPTGLVKREICRPPPKPPDRQNSLSYKHDTKKGIEKPYENKKGRQEIQNAEEEGIDAQKVDEELNYRPPPKAPYILNANGEVIGIIANIVPKTWSPLKTPRIHGSIDRERIDQEKECLLNTVLNHRPPPKPPPKSL